MSMFDLNDGIGGALFGSVASLRRNVALRRRVARDWASLERLDDRVLSDLGLWRERNGSQCRRCEIRF
ncbi:MAG: hypothetical protein KKB66_15490 [Alphaproteobacteria bacterium]|jgi:hypothetical protein|nr:hypothetical protein [Alphaproteobacteria bacterium]MBU0804597.1 hypothetical protein [Alphaproteobacteria bacterium]MBU0869982.1 hypothetical protein [Alphaproteobacteria bacterium]MBU1401009.1 hypothetical protein [Alphaproteobacteria bacterium]MBU1592574.1 hypothetical protein [Alphaproteobacteria bacterium]